MLQDVGFWVGIISGVFGIAAFFLQYGGHMKRIPLIKALLIVAIGLATVSIYLSTQKPTFQKVIVSSKIEKPQQPFATPDQLLGSHLRGLSFRISDLAREDMIIRNRVFEDCHIYGLATVALREGNIFSESIFDGTPDDLWIIVNPGKVLIGVIGLERCIFRRCHFHRVGFVGSAQDREMMRKGTTVIEGSPPPVSPTRGL